MPIRKAYSLGFFTICVLLLISVYLQVFQGFVPCPLCTLQRITFGLLGVLFLLGIFLYFKHVHRIVINTLLALSSLLGIALAGRQVWLQHFPTTESSECGVSLQYMIKVFPFNEVLQKIFTGTAECTQRGWEFLHLNMAEWSLVWFVLFLLMSLCLFLEELKWKH